MKIKLNLLKRYKTFKSINIEKILLTCLFFNFFIGNVFFIINLFLLLVVASHKEDKKILDLGKINTKLINFLPAVVLLSISYKSFNNKDLLFWDNQYLLHLFNCNIDSKFKYFLKFNNELYSCKQTLGFGILEELISFKIDPWFLSLIFILILFSLLIYFLQKFQNYEKLIFIIFLCTPSFTLLLTSLNLDLFFFIYLIYLVAYEKENFNIFDYVFITIFSQLKIYGIGLLLGTIFLNLIQGKIKKYPMLLIFTSLNVSFFIYGVFTREQSTFPNEIFGIPYVYAPLYSFGFLADVISYIDVQLSPLQNKYFLIICLVFFGSSFLYFKNRISFQYSKLEKTNFNLIIQMFPVLLLINLFGSSGYKYVFNFLIVFLLLPGLNVSGKVLLSLSFFLIPLYGILNLNNSHEIYDASYFTAFIWMVSRTSFYFLCFYYLTKFWQITLLLKTPRKEI